MEEYKIDELIIPSIQKYKDYNLKSVNHSDSVEELKSNEDKADEENLNPLIKKIKSVLGDQVKDVKASTRLKDSPSLCPL